MNLHHLTDRELVNQLTLRNDLTSIEMELLERLERSLDVIKDLEDEVPCCGPNT